MKFKGLPQLVQCSCYTFLGIHKHFFYKLLLQVHFFVPLPRKRSMTQKYFTDLACSTWLPRTRARASRWAPPSRRPRSRRPRSASRRRRGWPETEATLTASWPFSSDSTSLRHSTNGIFELLWSSSHSHLTAGVLGLVKHSQSIHPTFKTSFKFVHLNLNLLT